MASASANTVECCIEECRAALLHSLQVDWLNFTKSNQSFGSLAYELTSDRDSLAEDLTSLKVIPLFRHKNISFWVSISLSFLFIERTWAPTKAKIIVFSGDVSDTKKFPLLRAEWERNFDGEPEAIHAQPHWHVYTLNNQQQTQEVSPEAVEFGATKPSTSMTPGDIDLSHFHFAMEANWHSNGRGNQQQLLEIAALRNWIDGCTSYISEQLAYLCMKIDN